MSSTITDARVRRSRVRHDHRSSRRRRHLGLQGRAVLLLPYSCLDALQGGARFVPCAAEPGPGRSGAAPSKAGARVRLPDGPRGRPGSARRVPEVRHGARAGVADRCRRRGSSTPARCIRRSCATSPAPARSAAWRSSRERSSLDEGPNPELVDMTRRFWVAALLGLPVFLLAMGDMVARAWASAAAIDMRADELDRPDLRDAGRLLGRLAVLRARLGVDREPAREHVHADCARRRRRVSVQRRRHARAAALSRRLPRRTASSRPTSTPRWSSPCWCCSGRCSSCAPAAGRAPRFAQLLGLAPKTARVIRDGARGRRAARSRFGVGDLLRVRPGEKVPVDGVVVEGRSVGRRVDGDRRADPGREGRRAAR